MKICSVRGCPRPLEWNGLCHAHAEFLRRTGTTPTKPILDTLEARFMAKVVKKRNGCWIWIGATGNSGRYGSFSVNGQLQRAHRVAYELFVGPIPKGLVIDHVKNRGCTSTLCVNPAHLEPVTQPENIMRGTGYAAANARKTHCPRGHEYDVTLKSGGRWCSICHRDATREAQRRYRARKQAAG